MICPLCKGDIKDNLRSMSQNKLYWLYLSVISRETGEEEVKALHALFSEKLLPPVFLKVKGRNHVHEVETRMSTTELSKAEFSEYLLKIQAMTGIPIPDPHELEGYICGNASCPNCNQ